MNLTVRILKLLSDGEARTPKAIATRTCSARNTVCALLSDLYRRGVVGRYRRKYTASDSQIRDYLVAHGITSPIEKCVAPPVEAVTPRLPTARIVKTSRARTIRFVETPQDADPEHGVYYHRPQPAQAAMQPKSGPGMIW